MGNTWQRKRRSLRTLQSLKIHTFLNIKHLHRARAADATSFHNARVYPHRFKFFRIRQIFLHIFNNFQPRIGKSALRKREWERRYCIPTAVLNIYVSFY